MIKWEYAIVTVMENEQVVTTTVARPQINLLHVVDTSEGETLGDLTLNELANMGQQGWELVTTDGIIFWFKRPVAE